MMKRSAKDTKKKNEDNNKNQSNNGQDLTNKHNLRSSRNNKNMINLSQMSSNEIPLQFNSGGDRRESLNLDETENDTTNDDNDKAKLIRKTSLTGSHSDEDDHGKQNFRKDFANIAVLMFLYLLQGVPLGLAGSLPYILSSRKVSYADQGTFSFAFWPFSLKLLWAPIVDSLYFKKVGRRKSWLVPIQYLIGIFMFSFADFVQGLLDGSHSGSGSQNDIYILTGIFFMFTFLAATQDIAVDGWALTMLSKENVSWASTCNSVGQTAGWFIGNVIFLTLESVDFSNKYFRPIFGLESQTYGIVTIQKFMIFFGCLFVISTTLILIFKRESSEAEAHAEHHNEPHSIEDDLTLVQTYKLVWRILWLAPVKKIMLILLTVKIGFAADSMSVLKLIEAGVPKEKLGLLAVPLTPLQIILPLVIAKYTNGPNPLNFFIKAIPFRLAMGLLVAFWVYVTPYFRDANNDYPFYYYVICLVINAVHSVFGYSMFVSQMSFFARISDKAIGGTYMTLLNTMTNLGGNWPTTTALFVANVISIKYCFYDSVSTISKNATVLNNTMTTLINSNKCASDEDSNNCKLWGGACLFSLDPFYVITVFCTILGIIWLIVGRKTMYQLQALPKAAWKMPKSALRLK